jgi:hypothetical protein
MQEFKITKVNDYNKPQTRILQFRDEGIAAMKGKKTQRFIGYEEVIGITFNLCEDNHEFVIHNPTGDLRYRCESEEDLRMKLNYLKDHFEDYLTDRAIPFYSVEVSNLLMFHNVKKTYKKKSSLNIPSNHWEIDVELLSKLHCAKFTIG